MAPSDIATPASSRLPFWTKDLLALVLMWAAVAAVYWWPKQPGGTQLASDYYSLHVHRMTFAREALATTGTLPAWYPRELLGSPFWSNIQSFPFIPNRLLVLFFDPEGRFTYALAITLAAGLGATFAYLFSRRLGICEIGSAAAGWTFVCCGYFASRVAAGHLPLLEVYGALPLLLWCIESFAQARESGRPTTRWIVALAISSVCVVLAGHPQLPVYAIATSAIYALWRFGWRASPVPLLSMGLGMGCASFSLIPMLMLIGRSTRILRLSKAGNDLAMPYGRFLGFFFPWRDGAAAPLPKAQVQPFTYSDVAYFWDTFVYAGWLPWVAGIVLLMLLIQKRIAMSRNAKFVVLMGIAGIVLSLPAVQQITAMIPGTLLRSPARILYLTELALGMGLGAAIHVALRVTPAIWMRGAMGVVLLIHGLDVGLTSRTFDLRLPGMDQAAFERALAPALQTVGDGRIAMDGHVYLDSNRRYDDVGFFDSVILARPYALMMDLTGAPMTLNEQQVNGSLFSPRALETAGVKFVFTFLQLPHLRSIGQLDVLNAYVVNAPASRAAFFPVNRVVFVEDSQMRNAIRNPEFDPGQLLLIPRGDMPTSRAADISTEPAQVRYSRVHSDRIECSVTTGQPGYLRIIESWDPGWSATVNGRPANVSPALGALLAVPLEPGVNEVVLQFRTPGVRLGRVMTCLSVAGIVILIAVRRKRAATLDSPEKSARSVAAN